MNGHERVVKILLERDEVNCGKQNQYGQTPLLCATRRGHAGVAPQNLRLLTPHDWVGASLPRSFPLRVPQPMSHIPNDCNHCNDRHSSVCVSAPASSSLLSCTPCILSYRSLEHRLLVIALFPFLPEYAYRIYSS